MKQTISIPKGSKVFIDTNKNVIIFEKEDTFDLITFEGCCYYLGIDTHLPDVFFLPKKHAKAIISNYKLWVIAEAWNKRDGFVPDYDNSSQLKYYPYFRKDISGFAFIDSGYDYTSANVGSGSRLSFKTAARAKEFGLVYIDLFNDVLL